MEFIIVILFFSLCVSACISVFVKAHTMSQAGSDQNHAVLVAQSVAEYIKATGAADFKDYFNASKVDDNTYEIYYDGDWNTTKQEDAAYTTKIVLDRPAALLTAQITVQKEQNTIFELAVKKYLP